MTANLYSITVARNPERVPDLRRSAWAQPTLRYGLELMVADSYGRLVP